MLDIIWTCATIWVEQRSETMTDLSGSMTADMTVANTILAQIRGQDRWAMFAYGAKNLVGGDDFLQFDVNGVVFKGKVIIKLTAMDDYTITFGRMNRKTFEFDVKATAEGVYFDQLIEVLDHHIEGK